VQARDDQYEFESKQRLLEREQRLLEREQRHQARLLEEMNRPPSPPAIPSYSDGEVRYTRRERKTERKL
jgi:hypothetical protein